VVSPDLIGRDCTAAAPGTRLAGDITYLRTGEGWLYLATVTGLATKMVTGWQMYYQQSFPGRARARFAVADYIEVFYNRRRLHSSLGYRTPLEALTQFQAAAAAA
jgi:putative transposase